MQPATITMEMQFWRTEKVRARSPQTDRWRRLCILPPMPKLAAAALPLQGESGEPLARRMFRFGMVFGGHAALLALVLQHAPVLRLALPEPVQIPMAVRLIEVPPARPMPLKMPPPVAIQPAKALLPALQPAMRRPQTDTPHPALAATPAASPSPAALAVAQQPAAQSNESAPAATAAPSAPPVSAPLATTAVRFDADYLQNPAPAYPALSRRMREEGKILLQVKVSATGSAEQIQIRQGSGFPRLDEAALNTVRQWRFVPARRGDEAIAASVVVPIVFRLDS